MQSAEQTQYDKESDLMHLNVQLTNPDWSLVRIKSERLFSVVQDRQGRNPILFSLTEILLNWKEHETILFLFTSKSARVVIETADSQLDRSRS